jgi:hypothetical protein
MTPTVFLFVCFFAWMAPAVFADTDSSDLKYIEQNSLNGTAATNSFAQALNYCKTHPTRDGGTWNQWYFCPTSIVVSNNFKLCDYLGVVH